MTIILELVNYFGFNELQNFKIFWPEIEKLSISVNANVRTEALSFYKEISRSVGPSIKDFISHLKKVFIILTLIIIFLIVNLFLFLFFYYFLC